MKPANSSPHKAMIAFPSFILVATYSCVRSVMPEFFADVLMFLLGFILIMGGVQQIASLSMARRWMPVPGAFYLVPSLILIAGIIALFNPTGARNTAFIIIGVSSLVYSLTELINWFKFTRRRPKTPVVHDDDDIEDAKIIE